MQNCPEKLAHPAHRPDAKAALCKGSGGLLGCRVCSTSWGCRTCTSSTFEVWGLVGFRLSHFWFRFQLFVNTTKTERTSQEKVGLLSLRIQVGQFGRHPTVNWSRSKQRKTPPTIQRWGNLAVVYNTEWETNFLKRTKIVCVYHRLKKQIPSKFWKYGITKLRTLNATIQEASQVRKDNTLPKLFYKGLKVKTWQTGLDVNFTSNSSN